jgi:SAM-dependent methyltransferase
VAGRHRRIRRNAAKFSAHIRPEDDVLDFGCSGGWLLGNIACRRKMGVEVIPEAAAMARGHGLEVFDSPLAVPDRCADVIISNHVLEHTLDPLQVLRTLKAKLRPGGRIVFVVPCETVAVAYRPGDVNHHLFSWSPMNLGNLFTEAGYTVIESRPYLHKWPPFYRQIARLGGRRLFDLVSRLYALISRDHSQVRVVAKADA